MLVASRSLERVGDHAVDIGERVAYVVTGESREFTDPSRPVEWQLSRAPECACQGSLVGGSRL